MNFNSKADLEYHFIVNVISRPLFFEYLYLNVLLDVMGKLLNWSCLHMGQLYSTSDISDKSSRYFLLIQVTAHRHWSHNRNILSPILWLNVFIRGSVPTIRLRDYLAYYLAFSWNFCDCPDTESQVDFQSWFKSIRLFSTFHGINIQKMEGASHTTKLNIK